MFELSGKLYWCDVMMMREEHQGRDNNVTLYSSNRAAQIVCNSLGFRKHLARCLLGHFVIGLWDASDGETGWSWPPYIVDRTLAVACREGMVNALDSYKSA